eukprot:6202900-Pleurochrysis_carterae.AAC.1
MLTQASEPDLSTMTHLCELICSNLLRNMELDATSVDVSRVVSILAGSLVGGFVDPNDPNRAHLWTQTQMRQPANAHREACMHTVLIADTGPRSQPDNTNLTQLTTTDVAAARVDRVLLRILATPVLAVVVAALTSTGTSPPLSSRPWGISLPQCKETRHSVQLTCWLSWDFCATRYSSTGSLILYRSLCLPLSPHHLVLVRKCSSAVRQPRAKH